MKRRLPWGLLLSVLSVVGQPAYDLVITGGRIVDGTGAPWYRADVAVRNGRIAAVGVISRDSGRGHIDASGFVVAPGFIDVHSHAGRSVAGNPLLESLVRQGITTLIEGQDGGSPLPLRPALVKVAAMRPTLNFGYFVGHNTVRAQVMGTENRHASGEELERMRELTRQAMLDGAFGLSTGLFYVPGNYAPTDEVIELAKVAGRLGGMHISHMRDEAAQVLDSVRETIRIGEEGNLPTQITHHKTIGKAQHGLSRETLRLVAEARARGVDVTIDQYPYTASSTGTAALFPQWSLSGGAKALAERLDAPESRARIKAEIARRIREDRGAGDAKNVQFASCSFDSSLDGKTLADATRRAGLEPTPENAAEVALGLQRQGGCSAVYHAIAEEDVVRILQSPYTMIGTDGHAPGPREGVPHPRSYGTYPRILGTYVRERGLLTLEEAIRRMTGFPASRLKLQDRGLVRTGFVADILVFDPTTIRDRSDYAQPHQFAEGVRDLLVNGVPVLRNWKMTGERPGGIVYGPARVEDQNR